MFSKHTMSRFSGTKVIAVAKNYAAHRSEMRALESAAGVSPAAAPERPFFFIKPRSSVLNPGGSIVRPSRCADLHHEVELGVVIKRACTRSRADDWRSYVSGYVLALDMTARDLQAEAKRAGHPWTLGKCWDTFTPMSAVVSADAVPDPHALELWLKVDGVEKQRGSTGDMLARVPRLIEEISAVMTLEEGDVILTGTPQGVGPVLPGQVITGGITGMPAFDVSFPVVQG